MVALSFFGQLQESRKKMRKIMVSCAALIACFGGGSSAIAGAADNQKTASMAVIDTCRVQGSTVNIGTFTTTDTMQSLADKVGYGLDSTNQWVVGTDGTGSVTWGNITCTNGVKYLLTITGTGASGIGRVNTANGWFSAFQYVSQIGDTVIKGPGQLEQWGYAANPIFLANYGLKGLEGTGTGKPQVVKGSIPTWLIDRAGTNVGGQLLLGDKFGAAGTYTEKYTLNLSF